MMRRKNRLATIVVAATIVTSLILVSLHLSYPVAPSLKQNVYTKTFADSRHLVSLDVTIYYETELDGTWRVWYYGSKAYNITVLVKPTSINTTAVSIVQIIQCHVGAPLQLHTSSYAYTSLPDVHPVDLTPLDVGIDLTLYWTTNTSWVAASEKLSMAGVNLNFLKLDYVALWYHFIIRAILADGTQEIFNADDTIKIPICSPVK